MHEGSLEYLPEGFRDGARRNYEASEIAGQASRTIASINASGSSFGGGRSGSFTNALNTGATERSRSVERVSDNREILGAGGNSAADQGEDFDIQASFLASLGPDAQQVADGI